MTSTREKILDGNSFAKKYAALEERFRELAEAGGDIYIPNIRPSGPVDHVLIAMEPSFGRWARTPEAARQQLADGFQNFLYSPEDFLLHFAVQRYLCSGGETYHVTDFSKGAMLVEKAKKDRQKRYDLWYGLLFEEVALVARNTARVFAVGNAVDQHLARKGFPWSHQKVLHYSSQAAHARKLATRGRTAEFERLRKEVSHRDIVTVAEDVLSCSTMSDRLQDEAMQRLAAAEFTDSRRRLLFAYRRAFSEARSTR